MASMASVFTPPPPGGTSNSRLNGWKEIAAYFGRGVRTVQRWEKTFGMPVHRIGSGRGENVHAFSQELDGWLRLAGWTRDLSDRPGEAEPEGATARVAVGPETPAASAAASPRATRGWLVPVALVALAVLASAGVVAWRLRGAPQLSIAKVDGDDLRGYDADGKLLWVVPVRQGLAEAGFYAQDTGIGRTILVDDVDQDGRREVMVFARSGARRIVDELLCFDSDGHLRWTRRPARTIRFGSTDFAPAWLGHQLFVTKRGRARTLWAAWVHDQSGEFPCLLEKLSVATGRPESEFWSGGYIAFVDAAVVQARASILVGATNNDHRGASLAVFDEGSVNGSAPAEREDFKCRTCPPGNPRAFLVFPRLEVMRMTGGQPNILDARWQETGEMRVWVRQEGLGISGSVAYRLAPDLAPLRAEIDLGYISGHERLERARVLDHAFGDQDRAQAWPVLVQKDGKFIPVTGITER